MTAIDLAGFLLIFHVVLEQRHWGKFRPPVALVHGLLTAALSVGLALLGAQLGVAFLYFIRRRLKR